MPLPCDDTEHPVIPKKGSRGFSFAGVTVRVVAIMSHQERSEHPV